MATVIHTFSILGIQAYLVDIEVEYSRAIQKKGTSNSQVLIAMPK